MGNVYDRHCECWMHKSYGGNGGLEYLFPHPEHLEIFPEITASFKGASSWAISGGGGGGGGGKSAYQPVYGGVHIELQGKYDGPGVMNEL